MPFDPSTAVPDKDTFDPTTARPLGDPSSLTPETDDALLPPLPETAGPGEEGGGATWAGLRTAGIGAAALSPFAPALASGYLLNKALTSPRTTWAAEPGTATKAWEAIPGNLQRLYQEHATWDDPNAPVRPASLRAYFSSKMGLPPPDEGQPGGFWKGLNLARVPLDVLESLTPAYQGFKDIYEAGKGVYDVATGAKTISQAGEEMAPSDSKKLVGIEKKPFRERLSTGLDVTMQMLFAKQLAEGLVHPTGPAGENVKMTPDQFEEAAQVRLGELETKDTLSPVEQAEKANLQEGLSEGGDVSALAAQHGIETGGETDASKEPSTEGVVFQPEGGGVVQEAPLRQPRETAPAGEEPIPAEQPMVAETPAATHAPEPAPTIEPLVAPKTEPSAAAEPTTRETPSREEIGTGEAQPPPLETPPKVGTTVSHGGRQMDVVKVQPRSIKGTYFIHLRPAGKPKGKAVVIRWPQRQVSAASFKTRPPTDAFGEETTPVASYIIENGGILSQSGATKAGKYAGNEALWEDKPMLAHPTHRKIYDPNGEMPDVMAQNLANEGLLKDGSVGEMYRELEKESASIRGQVAAEREIARVERGVQAEVAKAGQQKEAFDAAQQKVYKEAASQGQVAPKVIAADLGIGDKVTVDGQEFKVTEIDPDALTVTLEDGKRFGIQEVTANEIIWGEHEPAPISDEFLPEGTTAKEEPFKLEKPESDAEMLARQKAEAEARAKSESEAEKKAQVKTGWQQKKTGTTGDLGQMEIEQVEARPQGDLFAQGKKLRLRAEKEGGYVNAEIMREVLDFGRRMYRKGMDFARWGAGMVRHLGSAIQEHLSALWRSITGQNILPHARERGSVPAPSPKRQKGFYAQSPAERQFTTFKAEADKKGFDPSPEVFEYWKNHLESLPEPGESFKAHSERVPAMQVNAANYQHAISNNQLTLASQIKRAAYKRGTSVEPMIGTKKEAPPKVTEGKPNEITVQLASLKGRKRTVSFVLPPEQITKAIQHHLAQGNTIISAPKDAMAKLANMQKADVMPSERAERGLPEWNPTKDEAPGVVNDANGSWKQPPPPGSSNGPTPPGDNPWQASKLSLKRKWRDWWENAWPRTAAMIRQQPDTPLVTGHHQWLADIQDGIFDYVDTPAHQALAKMDMNDVINQEDYDVKLYQYYRFGEGDHPDVAWEKSTRDSPLRPVYEHFRNGEEAETRAAKELMVPKPKRIEGPYLPRQTNEIGKAIIEAGYQEKTMGGMLRKSVSHFDESRVHDTMKDGINQAVPTQYDTAIEAAWFRNKYRTQLIATSKLVKNLRDKGVLFDKYEDALKASKDKDPQKLRASAFGGRDYWVRNRQEAVFIKQNFLDRGFNTPWSKLNELTNTWVRNPELINPAPHVTKNMGYKYLLKLVNMARYKADALEYAEGSDLRNTFDQYYPMPKSEQRIPQIEAREIGGWARKATAKGIGLNNWSQKFIFHMADPAMRFSLWKYYLRRGLGPQEAANRVAVDLVRYDENSGGLHLWKSVPFNWFATWRTGTYATLFDSLKRNPVSTLAFIGALDLAREIIYRKTGKWTHLPHDYLEAPIAEAVEATLRAKREMEAGRSPAKAVGGAAVSVAGILGSTFMFGPGGGQAPDTISQLMDVVKGDPGTRLRVLNMFFGLSQMWNMGGEFYQFLRDGKPEHLAGILSSAAFGTHTALKYEPRRAMKYLPPTLPGLAPSATVSGAAELRAAREEKVLKALSTSETRHGVSRGYFQGPEEQQLEDLARGAGFRPSQSRGGVRGLRKERR